MKTFDLKSLCPAQIAARIPGTRVLLVGDLCLDYYLYADMRMSRLSRETPHYPLPVVREAASPGGGGNVLMNLAALGGQVKAVSVLGKDWRGDLLTSALEKGGVDLSFVAKSERRVTNAYVKPMRMGISDAVYEDPRLDFENREPLSAADEEALLSALSEAAEEADIVAVADQMEHGVVTERVIDALADIAKMKPVVVDSRSRFSSFVGRGFLLKPNEVEAAAALGREVPEDDMAAYEEMGRALAEKNGQAVPVTLGPRGCLWCEAGEVTHIPTVPAEPPVDTVGAGDTFLSAFVSAFGAGVPGAEAAAFANLASGVTVKKLQTTGTASPEEIITLFESRVRQV